MKRISDKIDTTTVILAVSCIILLVALIVAVAYWDSSNSAYINLQSQTSAYVDDHSHTNEDYESLKSQFENAENQLSTSNNQSTVSQLQDQINSLQAQVNSLSNFPDNTTLVNVQNWSQAAGSDNTIYTYTLDYLGYIQLTLTSSSYETLIQMHDDYSSISYSIVENLGNYAYHLNLPVLSSPLSPATVTITITNNDTSIQASGTITLNYFY